MKKQVFTALALATMIGAASSGALAGMAGPLPTTPGGPSGLVILAPKTGETSATAGHVGTAAAMPAQTEYVGNATLTQQYLQDQATVQQNQTFTGQVSAAISNTFSKTVNFVSGFFSPN